ncbi:MAG: AP2 domain-containing protein [Sedimentisphaerales bacterium]
MRFLTELESRASERIMKMIEIMNWLDFIFVWPVMVYRWCKFGYTYRRIYLGEGKWTILEQADYYRLKHFKWIVYGNGNSGENLYVVRYKFVEPYKTIMVSMHREIMNANDERLIDHKNCNSLDNRKNNLRFATRAENTQNRRKKKSTSSRFIGVDFYKRDSNWQCRITNDGKRILIGRFDSEIAAARAYDEAAKKYYGEFARLNFPPESEESRALFARLITVARDLLLVTRNQRSAYSV